MSEETAKQDPPGAAVPDTQPAQAGGWFSSLASYSQNVRELGASVGKTVQEYGQSVANEESVASLASQVKGKLASVQQTVADKVAASQEALEQEYKKHQERVAELEVSEEGKPAWSLPPHMAIFEDDLRAEVHKLIEEDVFLHDPPADKEFEFNFKSEVANCKAGLDQMPELASARFRVVPMLISEERFWRNFNYHVAQARVNVCGVDHLDVDDNDNTSNNEEEDKQVRDASVGEDPVVVIDEKNDARDEADTMAAVVVVDSTNDKTNNDDDKELEELEGELGALDLALQEELGLDQLGGVDETAFDDCDVEELERTIQNELASQQATTT